MRNFGYSMSIDGPAFEIQAKTVFEAREKIFEKHWLHAYVVWEERYERVRVR